MTVFDLEAILRLDKTQYENGLDQAESSANKFGSSLSKGIGSAAKVAVAALAAVGTAVGAASKAFIDGVSSVAEYGDAIDKGSQKMGISAQAYQEWDAVLQHSGTSIDAMKRAMITLQKQAVNSADKFEKLGISQAQVASMSTEDLFAATINGLQQMGESAERTALASELLGGGARELGALLNTSAEDTQKMIDRVHELGGVMSDEAVKAAARYEDSLQDMRTSIDGLKRNILSQFMPSITMVMDGMTDLFAGREVDLDRVINEAVASAETALDNVMPMIERIIDGIVKLVEKIAPILEEKLPILVDRLLPAILKAGKALLSGILPVLPKVAWTIVETLFNAMVEHAPALIPVVAAVLAKPILGIIKTITGGIGMLKTALGSIGGAASSASSAMGTVASAGSGLAGALSTAATAALGVADAVLVAYDVSTLVNAAKEYNNAHETHIKETETALDTYAKLYQEKGKEVADEWASMVYQIDTTGMSMDEAQQALADKVETYWDGVPQSLWDGFKAGWDYYFVSGEGGGILGLLGDAFNGVKDWICNLFGIHSPSTVFESIGANLMAGLQQGIIEGALHVIETAKGVARSILNAIKGFFGIHSPSTVMEEMGGYLDEGFAKGIFGKEKLITNAMDDVFNVQPTIAQNTSRNTGMAIKGEEIIVPRNSSGDGGNQQAIMMVDRTVFARLIYTLYNEYDAKVGVQIAGARI